MKKATKLTAAALAATLSLSLAACGSSASTGTASTSASADGVVYRTLDEIKADDKGDDLTDDEDFSDDDEDFNFGSLFEEVEDDGSDDEE